MLRWGVAAEASLPNLPLPSCCATPFGRPRTSRYWFATRGLGDPCKITVKVRLLTGIHESFGVKDCG